MAQANFRGYNRVKFQSLKLGKTIFCQSLFLRDYLLHLEWDESVRFYELKPFKITYKTEGRRRRSIHPHLLINTFEDQQIIVWLKSSISDEEKHNQILKLLTNFCETKGFRFLVKFPEEIRKEPLFSNLKFLRRYSRCEITFQHTVLCRDFFNKISFPSLGELIQFFSEKNENIQIVYALLSQKIVSADVNSSLINYDTPVKLQNRFPSFQNGRIAA